MTPEPTIIDYLLGESDFEGVWFGEKHPESKGLFWWRIHLRKYASEKDKEIAELTDRIGQLEKLIEKASWLVGNPGCNISSSTDLSCDGWQKEWEQYKSSKPTNP